MDSFRAARWGALLLCALLTGCLLKIAPFLLFGVNPFAKNPCLAPDAGCCPEGRTYVEDRPQPDGCYTWDNCGCWDDAGAHSYGCEPGDTCRSGTGAAYELLPGYVDDAGRAHAWIDGGYEP